MTGPARSRSLTQLALLLPPVLAWGGGAASCGGVGAESSVEGPVVAIVETLESLAFVPRGRTFVWSPIEAGADVDLVVDRFEVTWGKWWEINGALGTGLAVPEDYQPPLGTAEEQFIPSAWIEDVPATGMSLVDARLFAAARGMRIPTFDEWMWCAIGPRNRRFPAGQNQRALANTADLGLFRPTPVGAFESGRTPDTGIYDLLGNVWEWLEAPADPDQGWSTIGVVSRPGARSDPDAAWCVGGSFLTPSRPLYNTLDRVCLASAVTETHRSKEIGLRCVASASEFLGELGRKAGPGRPLLSLPEEAQARIEAVGDRWGPPAVPALKALVEEGRGLPWTQILLDGAQLDDVGDGAGEGA